MSFSPSSPKAVSGLRTISRDWSDAPSKLQQHPTNASSSQEADQIDWPPSPKRPVRPPKPDYSDRMAQIQAALDAARHSSQELLDAGSHSKATKKSSTVPRKRILDSENQPLVAAKKRVLPASFNQREVNVKKEFEQSYSTSVPPALPKAQNDSFGASSIAPRAYAPQTEEDDEKVPSIFLSNEQQQILRLVETGCNVFFTGSAGTGKSVLLREIIQSLRRKYKNSTDAVAITASTGIAACNIGGITLHSFGGVGLGIDTPEHLATKIRRNKKASTRWLRTKVLIIDEISMVEGDFFDKLARIACIMRKNDKPFGGIQLVVCGDFFQLPPVQKFSNVKFAFEAEKWGECIERTFNLTKVFRQKDQEFVDMLNEMRFGKLSSSSIAKFKSLARPVHYQDGIEPTQLFPRREDVDRANQARLMTLKGETHTYRATDNGLADQETRDKLLANLMAPSVLQLRLDAQVMLIKNIDETLVNGSIGKVIGFVDSSALEAMDDSNGKAKKPKSNVGSASPRWPIIRFKIPGNKKDFRETPITPETWKIELPSGEVQASRFQLPLILAWAMSIHKSQGQTLERVKIDLNKVFEKGQAYVALSRATSLQGLEVYGFNDNKVQAHNKVVMWSSKLETLINA